MTIQNQEIKEVKASFGVNAEVADAIDKKAVSPGKVQKNGDQESESIPQGSSLPKTKISMINSVMSKLSQMKKEDVEQQLASMEEEGHEDELDEKYRRGGNPGPTTRQSAAILKKMKPLDPNATVIHKDSMYSSSKGYPHKDQLKDHIHKESGHKVMIPSTTNDMHDAVTGDKIATDVYSGKHTAKSLVRAVKKFHKEEYEMMDEEDEQIDELDASTLKSYKDKAVDSGRMAMITGNKPTLKKRTAGVKNVNKRLGETYKISREDIDVSEDIAAAFSGSDLSEEFKAQATEIFETAVVSSVNMKLAAMAEQAEEEYAEEMQNIEEGLTTKIDEYLDYVVEQWMEENRLAVESGLRSEVTENFLSGLRNLFAENWIDIPEEKVEVVEELAGEVEHLTATLDEEMQKNIELKKQVEKFEREIAFVEVSEGLTEIQIAKFESLAEAVDYEDAESYKENLETIRMSFFENRSEEVMESRTTLDEEFIETNETSEKKLDPSMQVYSAAISRSVKK